MEGPDAVGAILAQLEGFEAAASAWETEILPERISEYEPAWLDEQCLAGRFVWTRLAPRRSDPERGAAPVRATPIVLLARRNLRLWSALAGAADPPHLSAGAQRVAQYLAAHGASFFDEIAAGAGCCRRRPRRRSPSSWRSGSSTPTASRACGRCSCRPIGAGAAGGGAAGVLRSSAWMRPDAGRGSAAPRRAERALDEEAIEHVVRTLLRRWGVIFWRLLTREADWLPPWRDLLMCCRRLEARGEIRGGRFVAGFSGEQYAAPEAIALLREARRKPARDITCRSPAPIR